MSEQELKRRLAAELIKRNRQEQEEAYTDFTASQIYCPKCKRAMPVRERPLLHLPDGELFDFLCAGCGDSLGTRKC